MTRAEATALPKGGVRVPVVKIKRSVDELVPSLGVTGNQNGTGLDSFQRFLNVDLAMKDRLPGLYTRGCNVFVLSPWFLQKSPV